MMLCVAVVGALLVDAARSDACVRTFLYVGVVVVVVVGGGDGASSGARLTSSPSVTINSRLGQRITIRGD